MGSRFFDEDEVKKGTIGVKSLATNRKKTAHNPETDRSWRKSRLGLLLGANQYTDDNGKDEQL